MKKIVVALFLISQLVFANGETQSANMGLVIPGVGVTTGPQWASDINASLNIIDAHDHSAGRGVQVTPSGLNISSDLSIGGNNLTNIRAVRMGTQSGVLNGASDLGELYNNQGNLFYADGNGNQVQITLNGSVAGATGSISGLNSPASASYNSGSQTFIWQSGSNTAANMDAGSLLMRNITANSKALTLSPPAAMGSNYSVTLPTLPASQKIMTLDASGNMSAPYTVDNSTLDISSNLLEVAASGVGTTQIANGAVTQGKLASKTSTSSSSVSGFSGSSSSFVTLASVTYTSTGRPAIVSLQSTVITNSYIRVSGVSTSSEAFVTAQIAFFQDGGDIGVYDLGSVSYQRSTTPTYGSSINYSPSGFMRIIQPSAGSVTIDFKYKVSMTAGSGTGLFEASGFAVNVVEL